MLRDTVFEARMEGHLPMISKFANPSTSILHLAPNTAWMEDDRRFPGAVSRQLVASTVTASDLRAGAALVLCALAAEGESTIQNVSQISRGYSKVWKKLANVGASVSFEVGGQQVFASGVYEVLASGVYDEYPSPPTTHLPEGGEQMFASGVYDKYPGPPRTRLTPDQQL